MVDAKAQAREDARMVGQRQRRAGWQDALLVVRSCEPGTGGPRKPTTSGKLSLKEFSEISGLSQEQVRLLYKAWLLCATDEKATACVLHPNQLQPGDDDASIDSLADTPEELAKLWSKYYNKAKDSDSKPKPKFESETVPTEPQQDICNEEDEEYEEDRTDVLLDIKESVERSIGQLKILGEPKNEKEIKIINEIRELLRILLK